MKRFNATNSHLFGSRKLRIRLTSVGPVNFDDPIVDDSRCTIHSGMFTLSSKSVVLPGDQLISKESEYDSTAAALSNSSSISTAKDASLFRWLSKPMAIWRNGINGLAGAVFLEKLGTSCSELWFVKAVTSLKNPSKESMGEPSMNDLRSV